MDNGDRVKGKNRPGPTLDLFLQRGILSLLLEELLPIV